MKAHSKELVHAQQDAIAAAVGNDKDALADALNMHADACRCIPAVQDVYDGCVLK